MSETFTGLTKDDDFFLIGYLSFEDWPNLLALKRTLLEEVALLCMAYFAFL